jgi:hypothetical protein
MALRGALVDTAYRIRKQPDARKVEGSTVYAPTESEPIKARLTLSTAAERPEDGRVVTEPRPTLIVLKKDMRGNELDWKASDRIRVESRELGINTFEIDGDPQPMRKKRRIIGYSLTLRRTEENPNARVG